MRGTFNCFLYEKKFLTMLITEYSAAWVTHFEQISEKLLGVLAGVCVKIEHIGSTAVPGLAAKPIIDIDIVYNETADFENIRKKLSCYGYDYNGNQGVVGRDVFKRTGKTQDDLLDSIPHHLYVCRYDSAELHRHILFRDYLRKHETARTFYQQLKYELAQEANDDSKRYAASKELKASSFISFIIELARSEFPAFGKIDC